MSDENSRKVVKLLSKVSFLLFNGFIACKVSGYVP